MLPELKQRLDQQYLEMYPKSEMKTWEKVIYFLFMGLAIIYFGIHFIVYLIR